VCHYKSDIALFALGDLKLITLKIYWIPIFDEGSEKESVEVCSTIRGETCLFPYVHNGKKSIFKFKEN